MSSLRPGARDTIIGVRLRTLPPHLDATRRFPFAYAEFDRTLITRFSGLTSVCQKAASGESFRRRWKRLSEAFLDGRDRARLDGVCRRRAWTTIVVSEPFSSSLLRSVLASGEGSGTGGAACGRCPHRCDHPTRRLADGSTERIASMKEASSAVAGSPNSFAGGPFSQMRP